MYQFKEELDRDVYFMFDKKLVENRNWSMLLSAARVIFPVIASYANGNGEAFPEEETIAILSGITQKTVRGGVENLEGFPAIKTIEMLGPCNLSCKRPLSYTIKRTRTLCVSRTL